MADENTTPTPGASAPSTPETNTPPAGAPPEPKTARQRMNSMLKVVELFKALSDEDQKWVLAEIAKP